MGQEREDMMKDNKMNGIEMKEEVMPSKVKRVVIIEVEDASTDLVERLLRNLKNEDKGKNEREYIRIKDLEIMTDEKKVLKRGKKVELTWIEYEVMRYLMKHPGWVYTKEQIYEALWDEDSESAIQAVAIVISRLRKKIEDDPKKPEYVMTVQGYGYKFLNREYW